jgi:UDP-glucuronate 4-epimerase
MKILITGAAGFIGFHLVEKLILENHLVYGLDNFNTYYDVNLKYSRTKQHGIIPEELEYGKLVQSYKYENYYFVKGDISDKAFLDTCFDRNKFDLVINLAAQAGVRYSIENPTSYIDSNINGFMNILEGCRNFNVHKLIYASSSSVYGMNKKQPFSTQDNVDFPISLYAATKKSNELFAHTYSHLFNISTVGLRFFTVYGPWGRPDMAYFNFTNKILKGQPISIFNNGELKRDFTYIDDIIEGINSIIKENQNPQKSLQEGYKNAITNSKSPYRIYNIGNNKPVKLMEFVEAIQTACERKAILEYYPMQPGDVPITYADISDLESDFNFSPKVKISEGIQKFVNWYRKYYTEENKL